jgi:uncharacterized protein (DUF58 family)
MLPFAPDFRPRLMRLRAEMFRRSGGADGARASAREGRVEFKDHRPYAPGDDVRFLDWNAYLRSDALVVKTFALDVAPEAEVVIDRSASAGPEGSAQDRVARELGAATGFLALARGGRARLRTLGPRGLETTSEAVGARDGETWLRAFEALPTPDGAAAWDALDGLGAARRPGLVAALISDFLANEPPLRALSSLARAARPVAFLVLAHESPFASAASARAATLTDPETGADLSAFDDDAWRTAHGAARGEHAAAVAAACASRGVACATASGREPLDDLLRAAGLDRA